MSNLLDLIKGRKSVRSFDGNGISAENLEKLKEFSLGISNPFGITVQFIFLDALEHGLSSPVISGEKIYVCGTVKKQKYADVAFGYSFEKLVLYAWSLGIGTTWIGGTMNRETFEKAARLREDEMMPCVSPLGYPSSKKSIKETLMRKGIRADSRKTAEELFFEKSFETPLDLEKKKEIDNIMEMVRWAPSAVNKQPWRIVLSDDTFHFFEKKDKGYINEATGDLQKIDVGIALCHFIMGAEEAGMQPEVIVADPGTSRPEEVEYIASVKF